MKRRRKLKNTLEKLLMADNVVRIEGSKGELGTRETSRLGGNIALVVDGIKLEALRNEEVAEGIVLVVRREEIDLENIEQRKDKLVEKADGRVQNQDEKREDNRMFV